MMWLLCFNVCALHRLLRAVSRDTGLLSGVQPATALTK